MARQAKMSPEIAPKVYSIDTLPNHWIAEGTDGVLYKVPTEPGGWMRRDKYEGQSEALKPVSPQAARPNVWFVYGDIGNVTIAEG
jgi:hypothetical protein